MRKEDKRRRRDFSDDVRWKEKTFTKPFPRAPNLFLTVQSFTDGKPLTVRARKVTRKGFEVSLFQEEKLERHRRHAGQRVGYLAIFSPTNSGTLTDVVGGADYQLKQTRLTHRFKTVLGQEIRLEEERSKDRERKHARERVSVMRLGDGYFAQQVTDKEIDTTTVRRR